MEHECLWSGVGGCLWLCRKVMEGWKLVGGWKEGGESWWNWREGGGRVEGR